MKKAGRPPCAAWPLFLLLLSLGLALGLAPAWADHDGHGKNGKHKRSGSGAAFSQDPAYKQECGACHLAYPPFLLPARSWEKLLANPSDHFGEQLPLDTPALAKVKEYLLANAADKSSCKRARKIMASLGGSTPTRMGDISYLRDKHHDISNEVWSRQSVGGLANCRACHPGAEAGDFDDHAARIPR